MQIAPFFPFFVPPLILPFLFFSFENHSHFAKTISEKNPINIEDYLEYLNIPMYKTFKNRISTSVKNFKYAISETF
jgi:hypothetical protein